MKKPTMIAAGLLVLLVLLFFVLSGRQTNAPEKIDFEIPKYENLEKIEVVKGDKTVVLARDGEGWRLKAPVDYPVSEGVKKELDKLFSRAIGMDRRLTKGSDAAKYGLDKDTATLSFFEGGQKKLSIVVGKESTVTGTFVKRTWIKREGEDTIYRAKAGLRAKLVLGADEMRNKKLVDFKAEDVASIALTYAAKDVVFERAALPAPKEGDKAKEGWKLVGSAEKVDEAGLNSLAGAASRLRADGFEDTKSDAETGLDPSALKVTFTLKSKKTISIVLGGVVKPEGEPSKAGPERYLKLGDAKWIYTVSATTAKQLDKRLADLRSKEMMSLEPSQVEKITFAAAQTVATQIVLTDGKWKVTAPSPGDASMDLVGAALKTLQNLKASRVPDVSADAAGLSEGQATHISLTVAGGETRNLFIGKKVAVGKDDRYARVGASGPIFEVLGLNAEKILKLNAKDLVKATPSPAK